MADTLRLRRASAPVDGDITETLPGCNVEQEQLNWADKQTPVYDADEDVDRSEKVNSRFG